MRARAQLGLLLAKDWRHVRLWAAGAWFFQALGWTLLLGAVRGWWEAAPGGVGFLVMGSYAFVFGGLAALFQLDPAREPTAFWRILPIQPVALVASKLLLGAAAFIGVLLLLRLGFLLAMPMEHRPALLGLHLFNSFLIHALVLGVLTFPLALMRWPKLLALWGVLWVALIVTPYFGLTSVHHHWSLNPVPEQAASLRASAAVVQLLAGVAAISFAMIVFFNRRSWLAVAVKVALPAAVAIAAARYWPIDYIGPLRAAPPVAVAEAEPVAIDIEWREARPGGIRTDGRREIRQLRAQYNASLAEPFAVVPHSLSVVAEKDGVRQAPLQAFAVSDRDLDWGPLLQTGRSRQPTFFPLYEVTRTADRWSPVNLNLEGTAVFEIVVPIELFSVPLEEGQRLTTGETAWRILRYRWRDDELTVDLLSVRHRPFDLPAHSAAGTTGFAISREGGDRLHGAERSPTRASFDLGSLSFGTVEARFKIEPPAAGGPVELRLHVLELRRAGTHEEPFRFEDISITP